MLLNVGSETTRADSTHLPPLTAPNATSSTSFCSAKAHTHPASCQAPTADSGPGKGQETDAHGRPEQEPDTLPAGRPQERRSAATLRPLSRTLGILGYRRSSRPAQRPLSGLALMPPLFAATRRRSSNPVALSRTTTRNRTLRTGSPHREGATGWGRSAQAPEPRAKSGVLPGGGAERRAEREAVRTRATSLSPGYCEKSMRTQWEFSGDFRTLPAYRTIS
ncbi:uncharacterized protein [Saccopteryx bilineata]|uniref:uncharacterized protein n=1 Tax=Saccopteryx bilineata TaxID=59482 RepID=UPI00338F96B1